MASPETVELIFENSIRRSEKKITNPTKALIVNVLAEAGFEGVWELKDSRRIKKKGRERFGAIRLESRAGARSIRMWCKPRGNDTAFEYSLLPPAGTDLQMAFAVLKRVSPITLRVAESPVLPLAVKARVLLDAPPLPPLQMEEQFFEVADDPTPVPANDAEPTTTEGLPKGDLKAQTPTEPAEEPAFERMELDGTEILSDHSAMDRALVAIGFVAEFGYAKRVEASSSIVRSLGIKNFVSGLSPTYTSIEGAMRALTMALRKKGRYIERVKCDPHGGKGVSEGVKGYRLTTAGERRLEAVKGKFGPAAEARLNPLWRRGAVQPTSKAQEPPQAVTACEAGASVSPVSIGRLKDLLASYEDSQRQVEEIDGLLGQMEDDMKSLRLDIEALELAEREKMRQIESIKEEAERIASKKAEAQRKLAQKESERKEWEDVKSPHQKEKDRIGSMLSVLEGR